MSKNVKPLWPLMPKKNNSNNNNNNNNKPQRKQQRIPSSSPSFLKLKKYHQNDSSTNNRLRMSMTPSSKKARDVICHWLQTTLHEGCTLNDMGLCAFRYNEAIIVVEVPANIVNGTFFFYSVLIKDIESHNPQQQMKLMQRALELNYMQQETKGGCLSLDGNELTLCFSHKINDCDSKLFDGLVSQFASTVSELRMEFVHLMMMNGNQ